MSDKQTPTGGLKVRTNFRAVYGSTSIPLRGPGIMFVNQGTATVTFNKNLTLAGGANLTLPEMALGIEGITQEFDIKFGETGTKDLVIIERTYES